MIDVSAVTEAIGAVGVAVAAVGIAVLLADVLVASYDWFRLLLGDSQLRGDVESYEQDSAEGHFGNTYKGGMPPKGW